MKIGVQSDGMLIIYGEDGIPIKLYRQHEVYESYRGVQLPIFDLCTLDDAPMEVIIEMYEGLKKEDRIGQFDWERTDELIRIKQLEQETGAFKLSNWLQFEEN